MKRKGTIAVVYTEDSPCRCGPALLGAVRALGYRARAVPAEKLTECLGVIERADFVFEQLETVDGSVAKRVETRYLVAKRGRLVGTAPDWALIADSRIVAHVLLSGRRIPVPRAQILGRRPRAAEFEKLSAPLVLKAPFEHGSRGVRLVASLDLLRPALLSLFPVPAPFGSPQQVLCEEFIPGRELAVSVVEVNGKPWVLPPVEVVLPKGRIYDEAMKWGEADLPIRAARLAPALRKRVERVASRAFRVLELRDYARFDVRIDSRGTPRILDANVRPSMEPGTEFPLAGKLAGLEFPALIELILRSAAPRFGAR